MQCSKNESQRIVGRCHSFSSSYIHIRHLSGRKVDLDASATLNTTSSRVNYQATTAEIQQW
jgi:hypothetical protein